MFRARQCPDSGAWSWRAALCALCCLLGCAHGGDSVLSRSLTGPPGNVASALRADSIGARRVALVIGNQSYLTAPLRNPRNDAHAMSEALTELGFEVIARTDASQADMRQALKAFKARLHETKALGLFYYSGHGVQLNDRNFLVPVDASPKDAADVAYGSLSVDEVLASMRAARSGTNIVFLDACRNNPFPVVDKDLGRGLARMDPPEETLLAFATGPGATAGDGKGTYGIWTGALLEHIREPGLEVEQILRLTTADVIKETQGAQTPWRATNWSVAVVLNQEKRAEAQELLRLASKDYDTGDYLSAMHDLRQALASERDPLTPRQRAEAEMLSERARAQLAYLRFLIDPHSAMVRVDSTMHFSRDGVMELNPGAHQLQISDDGYRPVERSIELAPGATQDLRVTLARAPEEKHARDWLPWTLGGASVAALAVSATTWALSGKAERRLDQRCGDDMACPDSFDWREERRQGRRLSVTGDVMLGVSLAAASAALLVRYWPGLFGARADRAQASVVCTHAGCSAWGRVGY